MTNQSITFTPNPSININKVDVHDIDFNKYVQQTFYNNKSCFGDGDKSTGKVLFSVNGTSISEKTITTPLNNGLVGTALEAYNNHHHLVLSPDDIWISIGVSFARYVDKHSKRLKNVFVSHDGKIQLEAHGNGNIHSANYGDLVLQIVKQIQQNTKSDVREWIECDFTTTTDHTRLISQLLCMASMKNYFSYKMYLRCGLPKVTLKGTKNDWIKIYKKVEFLRSEQLDDQVLQQWSYVLQYVLQEFVNVYDNKINNDFWNRIAHKTGSGSGPRYIEGWILAFSPFDDSVKYSLYSMDDIEQGKGFGKIDTNDVPSCTTFVPVTIDDNGRVYETQFLVGLMATNVSNGDTLSPNPSWALVDVTK